MTETIQIKHPVAKTCPQAHHAASQTQGLGRQTRVLPDKKKKKKEKKDTKLDIGSWAAQYEGAEVEK